MAACRRPIDAVALGSKPPGYVLLAAAPNALASMRALLCASISPSVSDETLTHEQALALIDERIGEEVYVGFLYASDSETDGLQPVQHFQGKLENPLNPRPPRLDREHGFYGIGVSSFGLPPLTGTVHLRDNGIDFRVADGAMIRVAWRGSSEVGIGARRARASPGSTKSGSSCPNTKSRASSCRRKRTRRRSSYPLSWECGAKTFGSPLGLIGSAHAVSAAGAASIQVSDPPDHLVVQMPSG